MFEHRFTAYSSTVLRRTPYGLLECQEQSFISYPSSGNELRQHRRCRSRATAFASARTSRNGAKRATQSLCPDVMACALCVTRNFVSIIGSLFFGHVPTQAGTLARVVCQCWCTPDSGALPGAPAVPAKVQPLECAL